MTTCYPFHEVIAGALTEAFENLIRKSIGELSLTFKTVEENELSYYVITNGDKPQVILYFSYEKLGFEDRLEQFWQFLEKQRAKHNDQISASVVGIGPWGLIKFREFKKNRTGFNMAGDSLIIDTFRWYDFEIDEDLTMDIDNYIRYQNFLNDEKLELADILLGGANSAIDLAIKRASCHGLKD